MPVPHQQELLRRKRRRQAEVRRRRLRFASLLVLFLLVATAYGVMSLANRSTAQVSEAELLVSEQTDARPVDAAEGHPVFARLDDRNLVLPVSAGDSTIIAYHPLSDERAYSLSPVGRQVNGGMVSRGIERVFAGEASVRYYLLKSKGRAVAETAAVDVGAPADTPITAPVSGRVSAVKTYQLYGKYEDVQIDIEPEGLSGVQVSLLFVKDPAVTIGQTVVAGKTQLGKVRPAQGDLGQRLAEYTHDSGSHVHLQVVREPLP